MSVIVEFSVDDDQFTLGKALAEPKMVIELERVVPLGDSIIPFIWVRGGDFEAFERHATATPCIDELVVIDRLDDHVLYRIEWSCDHRDLMKCIVKTGASILEAHGNDEWVFRLRFSDHEALSAFYNVCMEEGIKIHIDRTYTLTEKTDSGHQFDLSQPQREALVAALRQGYFATPSEVSLQALAEQFDVSSQAMSDRIRRGSEKVLREALLASASEFE